MNDTRGPGDPKQEYMIKDIQYKIGTLGFVYYRSAFGDWVKSAISKAELMRMVRNG
jgi:hypothetical protein